MTASSGNKKAKKPPVGVDTHMIGNRLAAAAGVGRRGADNKVILPHAMLDLLAAVFRHRLHPGTSLLVSQPSSELRALA